MTKWIRLRENISGGRADGRSWPPANEVSIDVPDWEAEHAINAGWAYEVDPPEPEKAPAEPVRVQAEVLEVNEAGHPTGNLTEAVADEPGQPADEPGQPADEPGQPADEPGQPADEPEPPAEPDAAEEAVPEPPRPSDPKQDWIDYAVTQGMDEGKAAAVSKADLMSRFGGRL